MITLQAKGELRSAGNGIRVGCNEVNRRVGAIVFFDDEQDPNTRFRIGTRCFGVCEPFSVMTGEKIQVRRSGEILALTLTVEELMIPGGVKLSRPN